MPKYKVLEPCWKDGKLWAPGETFSSDKDHSLSKALEQMPDDAPLKPPEKKAKPEEPKK